MSSPLQGWAIHAVCFGTGGTGVMKVRSRAHVLPHRIMPSGSRAATATWLTGSATVSESSG